MSTFSPKRSWTRIRTATTSYPRKGSGPHPNHGQIQDRPAIVCHLGGFQWQDAVKLNAYFDMSAILPDHVLRYGIEKSNEILRQFPADRLLFATDWPCSRSCRTEEIYERYFDILNQMDFTEAEARQIAFDNIARLLWK